MKTEVIMATYNNVEVMRLVFEGYTRQRDREFTLCIADDGSSSEVGDLIDEYGSLGLSIRHIRQEDRGFRKAQIVNKAIATSDAEYLILTDNDCIPSPHLVGDHKAWARSGHYVAGRRVDLKASLTEKLLKRQVRLERLDSFAFLLREAMRGGLKRAENAMRPPAWLSVRWSRKPQGLLGANFGIWREDMLAINGFDCDFEGYGAEETDLEWRLKAAGVVSRPIRGRACLFHMYHKERSAGPQTRLILEQKLREGNIVAARGITSLDAHRQATLAR